MADPSPMTGGGEDEGGDELDIDIEDLEDLMEDHPGDATATIPIESTGSAAAIGPSGSQEEDDEEEEEEQSGIVMTGIPVAATIAGIPTSGALAAIPAASLGGMAATATAAAKPKKKRKSTSKKDLTALDEERQTKQQRTDEIGDATAGGGESREVTPAFNLPSLKKVVNALVSPIPPSRIPTSLPYVLGELGKKCIEEVIAEAIRVRNGNSGMSKTKMQRGSSAIGHNEPLTPAQLREAYRRLVNSGAIPSRVVSSAPVVGLTGSLDEESIQPQGRMKRQVAWRR